MDLVALEKRIKELCEQNGISPNKLFSESKVGKDFFYNLHHSKTPSSEKLQRIADYFQVSTDYLLKGENPPARTAGGLPPDQQKVIEYYERLNIEHQDYIKGEMVRLYMAEQAEREGAASSDEAM